MKTCILAIVFLSLTVSWASAQDDNGSAAYLQTMCQSHTRIENKMDDAADYQKAAWCTGYISGVVSADTEREKPFLHIPEGVTTGEIQKVVMRFMDEHPEILHDPSVFVIRVALFHAYGQQPSTVKRRKGSH